MSHIGNFEHVGASFCHRCEYSINVNGGGRSGEIMVRRHGDATGLVNLFNYVDCTRVTNFKVDRVGEGGQNGKKVRVLTVRKINEAPFGDCANCCQQRKRALIRHELESSA